MTFDPIVEKLKREDRISAAHFNSRFQEEYARERAEKEKRSPRERWDHLPLLVQVAVVAFVVTALIAAMAAELAAIWYFFPAVKWWHLALGYLAFAVLARAFRVYKKKRSSQVVYVLAPIFFVLSLPGFAAIGVVAVIGAVLCLLYLCADNLANWTPSVPMLPIFLFIAVFGGVAAYVMVNRDHAPQATAVVLWTEDGK